MNSDLRLFGSLAALVIGVFAWLRWRLPKAAAEDAARRQRMFETAGVTGDVDWVAEKEAFVFKHAGRDCSLRYVSEGPSFADVHEGTNIDASVTWACLETPADPKWSFRLKRKGTAGSPQRVDTGDAGFDDRFSIATETPDLASSFFAVEERRRVVRELFGLGYGAIVRDGGRLSLYWRPAADERAGGDGPILREGLESLGQFAGVPAE